MNDVARTILNQLGGNKFIAMTGSKNFVAGKNYLNMTLYKNVSSANILKMELNSDNTYTMIFTRYVPSRFNSNTMTFTEDKKTIIKNLKMYIATNYKNYLLV